MSVDVKALEAATEKLVTFGLHRNWAKRYAETAIEAYTAALPPAPHGGAEVVTLRPKVRRIIDGVRLKWKQTTMYRGIHGHATELEIDQLLDALVTELASPPQEQEAAPKGEAVAWCNAAELDKMRRWPYEEALVYFEETAWKKTPLYTAPSSPKAEPEQEAVAWLHTMHQDLGQTETVITTCKDHPFGNPGRDFSESYRVSSEALVRQRAPEVK